MHAADDHKITIDCETPLCSCVPISMIFQDHIANNASLACLSSIEPTRNPPVNMSKSAQSCPAHIETLTMAPSHSSQAYAIACNKQCKTNYPSCQLMYTVVSVKPSPSPLDTTCAISCDNKTYVTSPHTISPSACARISSSLCKLSAPPSAPLPIAAIAICITCIIATFVLYGIIGARVGWHWWRSPHQETRWRTPELKR